MGSFTLQGSAPFELSTLEEPRVHAEDEAIVVAFPMFIAGAPGRVVDLRLLLSIPHAKHLAAQLQTELTRAEAHSRKGP